MPACKNCGRPYDSEQSFCAGCGRPILQIPAEAPPACPACGAVASPGTRFCAQCGSALEACADPASGAAGRTESAAPPQTEQTLPEDASSASTFAVSAAEAGEPSAPGKKLTAVQIAVLGVVIGLLLGGVYLAYTAWRIGEQHKTETALARALQENAFVPGNPAESVASAAGRSPHSSVKSPPRSGKSAAKKFVSGPWQVASGEPQANAETAPSAAAAPPPPPAAPAKTPIRVLREAPPKFPMAAKLTLSSGDVHVRVAVGTAGDPLATISISGPRVLRKAACDSVEHWRFKPATVNGKPVEDETEVVVHFTFEQD